MARATTRAIIGIMVTTRLMGSALIISALLFAACKDTSKPQPTADTASVTDTTAKPAETTAATDSSGEPQAKATGEPSADATAKPDGEDGDETAKAGGANTADPSNPASDKPDDPEDKPEDPVAAASGSASAAPEEPAGKTFGKKQVESMYAAWLQSAGRYTVGKASSVQAVVVAKGEYKCNDNYPYKFKLNAAPAGISFPSNISRAVSKGKARSVVSVPFTPTSAGEKTISGTFYFSVCNDSTCKIAKKPLSVTVTVHDS